MSERPIRYRLTPLHDTRGRLVFEFTVTMDGNSRTALLNIGIVEGLVTLLRGPEDRVNLGIIDVTMSKAGRYALAEYLEMVIAPPT